MPVPAAPPAVPMASALVSRRWRALLTSAALVDDLECGPTGVGCGCATGASDGGAPAPTPEELLSPVEVAEEDDEEEPRMETAATACVEAVVPETTVAGTASGARVGAEESSFVEVVGRFEDESVEAEVSVRGSLCVSCWTGFVIAGRKPSLRDALCAGDERRKLAEPEPSGSILIQAAFLQATPSINLSVNVAKFRRWPVQVPGQVRGIRHCPGLRRMTKSEQRAKGSLCLATRYAGDDAFEALRQSLLVVGCLGRVVCVEWK